MKGNDTYDSRSNSVQRVAKHEGREIFLASYSHVRDLLLQKSPLRQKFVLALWFDFSAYDDIESLAECARRLLMWGAVAVHCGGSAAEIVHDIVDEVIVNSAIATTSGEREFPEYVYNAMDTSWLGDEPICGVLWSSLHAAYLPENVRAKSTPVVVIIVSEQQELLREGLLKELSGGGL